MDVAVTPNRRAASDCEYPCSTTSRAAPKRNSLSYRFAMLGTPFQRPILLAVPVSASRWAPHPDDDPDLWEIAINTILAEAGRLCGEIREDDFSQKGERFWYALGRDGDKGEER